jgi:hypothetical protein
MFGRNASVGPREVDFGPETGSFVRIWHAECMDIGGNPKHSGEHEVAYACSPDDPGDELLCTGLVR